MSDPSETESEAARWRPYSHRRRDAVADRWVVESGPVLVWNGRTLPVQMQWRDGDAAYTALIRHVEDSTVTLAAARAVVADAVKHSRLPAGEMALLAWVSELLDGNTP